MRLQHFAVAQVHVYAAGQAGIEAANRAHNIDAFEILRPIFFEDRRVLHRVLVRSGSASWKPQPIASSGTLKSVQVFV